MELCVFTGEKKMINESTKKIVVGIIAVAFIGAAFLPTVQSRLGTVLSTQPQITQPEHKDQTFSQTSTETTRRTTPDHPAPLDVPPNIHLPPGQVTMKVFTSTQSYFRTLLSNVPSGYEVSNGNYTGWCTDSTHYIYLNTSYQVTLYSSYNTSLPSHLYHQNWSKVNYILNHKVGNDWHQVQNAILYILNFGNQGLNADGWAMVNASISNGGSYIPGGGNIIAVIADAGITIQRTIFELIVPTYTLSISTNGTGTVTKNPNQTGYTYGQVVTLTANPAVGWSFDHWSGNASGSSPVTTVTMNGNKAVTAHFTQNVYTLTVTIDPTGGGSVNATPAPPYHYGDVVTLNATPNIGYSFDHWSGNASGSNPVTTVTMNGNRSVVAHFTQNVYTLTVSVVPVGGGSVNKTPVPPYHYGDVVTLTATPNIGYSFDHWSGNASGSNPVTTVTMNGNKSVTAHFTQNVYTLTVTIDPVAGGSVNKTPVPPYHYGDVVTLTATAAVGYSFDHWSGNASGSSPVTTVTMNGNKAVTAHFTQNVYTLTVTIDPTGGGSVNATPAPPYHYGDVVTLNATPNIGYSFDHWSGNASGSNPVTTVTMDGNKSVTAHFTQNVYTLTVTVDPAAGGSVSTTPAPPYHYNDVVRLTATANHDYRFDHWSGDATGSSPTTNVTMNGNKSVTAHFTFIGDITPPTVAIAKPLNAIYLFNKPVLPFKKPIIIQWCTIEVNASDNQSGINRVEFYVDNVSKGNDSTAPYSYDWKDSLIGEHTIKATAYDNEGNSASTEIKVLKWRLHPILALTLVLIGKFLLFLEIIWQTYHHPGQNTH